MRNIIVQDESDEESEEENNTEFINESIINIISKHANIYTYEDIFLYECDMIDLINTKNINFTRKEEIKLETHLDIHQTFILNSISNYTKNLINNLVNNITEHYKKTLLTACSIFERELNIIGLSTPNLPLKKTFRVEFIVFKIKLQTTIYDSFV